MNPFLLIGLAGLGAWAVNQPPTSTSSGNGGGGGGGGPQGGTGCNCSAADQALDAAAGTPGACCNASTPPPIDTSTQVSDPSDAQSTQIGSMPLREEEQ